MTSQRGVQIGKQIEAMELQFDTMEHQ